MVHNLLLFTAGILAICVASFNWFLLAKINMTARLALVLLVILYKCYFFI